MSVQRRADRKCSRRLMQREFEKAAHPIIHAIASNEPLASRKYQKHFDVLNSHLFLMALGILIRLGVPNPHRVAEDCRQEWYVKMLTKRFKNYLRNRGPFFPFARHTLLNICIDARRSFKCFSLTAPDRIDPRLNPLKAAIRGETELLVRKAFSRLSREDAYVLRRRCEDNMRNSQIAQETRSNPTTIGSRIYRGLKRLRDDLERRKDDVWPLDSQYQ